MPGVCGDCCGRGAPVGGGAELAEGGKGADCWPVGVYGLGDGARLLCREPGRGFACTGRSSKKPLWLRRAGAEAFWFRGGPGGAAAADGGPAEGGRFGDVMLALLGGAGDSSLGSCCMLARFLGLIVVFTRSVGRSYGDA